MFNPHPGLPQICRNHVCICPFLWIFVLSRTILLGMGDLSRKLAIYVVFIWYMTPKVTLNFAKHPARQLTYALPDAFRNFMMYLFCFVSLSLYQKKYLLKTIPHCSGNHFHQSIFITVYCVHYNHTEICTILND